MNKRGLGRGLDSFFSPSIPADNESIKEIAISDIFPNKAQPRHVFDDEKLADLVQSIRQYGVIQPIVLRRTLKGFEIVAGERRWRASQTAGLKYIPAVVREYTDAEMTEIALIENIQRQDLNAIEEAIAYKRLMSDFGLTQDEVALKIGRSRSFIANTIRLLQLNNVIQEHVSRGTLTMGQVRPLLAIENLELQLEIATQIIDQDLSARDVEELVRRIGQTPKKNKKQPQDKEHLFVAEAEDRLKLLLGTQVKIKPGKLKSKIEIEFYSHEDLDRIIESLSIPRVAATIKKSPGGIVV